jgi:hypothetical protein
VLPLDAILTAMSAILLERKLIVVSAHARLLTPVAQSLQSLLFPLEWQYSYVPVLPRMCGGILDAPMPVFVGLRHAYLDPRLYDRHDAVLVELDAGLVHVPSANPLPVLPPALAQVLRTELETFGHLSSLPKLTKDELDSLDLTFNIVPSEVRRRMGKNGFADLLTDFGLAGAAAIVFCLGFGL